MSRQVRPRQLGFALDLMQRTGVALFHGMILCPAQFRRLNFRCLRLVPLINHDVRDAIECASLRSRSSMTRGGATQIANIFGYASRSDRSEKLEREDRIRGQRLPSMLEKSNVILSGIEQIGLNIKRDRF